ncbi:MAG TPA: DUF1553 domain-containing protein, partial [Luteitalea sp.]|nr:DUF1553 domain-containing protein [Luteitalea sp.]
LILPSSDAGTRLDALAGQRQALEGVLATRASASETDFAIWRQTRAAATTLPSAEGLVLHLPLDDMRPGTWRTKDRKTGAPMTNTGQAFVNLAKGGVAYLGGDQDRAPLTVPGRLGSGQQLRGDSEIKAPDDIGFFDRHQPFSLATWFRIDVKGTAGPLITRSGSFANGYRGYLIRVEDDGTISASLHHVAPDDSIVIRTTAPVAPGAWRHLAFTYDGSSQAAGLRLFLDGTAVETRTIVDNLRRSLIVSGIKNNPMSGAPLGVRLGSVGELSKESLRNVSVDDFRVYARQLSRLEVEALGDTADAMRRALADPSRTADLREHYRLLADPVWRKELAALTAIRDQENQLLTEQPSVMVMRDLPSPRPTFILARGAYDAPTDPVTPGTPQAILPFGKNLPANRLGLAQWLVSPENPLMARVFVNRYWAMLFGRGIVPTADDFGAQGTMPSHPALLDWLATTFVSSGWDTKAMLKTIVMSATYRQSSLVDAARRAEDPDNTWLARGPAYRLPLEQVRDAALAASGLLVRTIGGPSVYPYQPAGVWESLVAGSMYPQSTGEGLYRRSLYTAWKRTAPPPSAIAFDASERLTCITTRQRTNTPQQALVLMNDPQYVESARVLAEQAMRADATPEGRITFAMRRLLSRRPTRSEVEQLSRLHDSSRATYAADAAAATALLTVGEHRRDPALPADDLAAWTIVTSTIMNLDDAVFSR